MSRRDRDGGRTATPGPLYGVPRAVGPWWGSKGATPLWPHSFTLIGLMFPTPPSPG